MKVFAIPTGTSGFNAALSMLFFTGLSHGFGDRVLGQIILLQASVALIQMVTVPQGWLYVIGSRDRETLIRRYSQALTTEIAGIGVGLVALLLALALPFGFVSGWRDGAVLMYFSLVIQASSSCLGLLRVREDWRRYSLWVLGSNLIRVPLVWAMPSIVATGWIPSPVTPGRLILYLFLIPDLIRAILIYLPLALRDYRWPGLDAITANAPFILQNWFFDVGSAVTEVADKIVVGAVLGPVTLVPYFFARKLAVITTMATEPFYAEHYRRLLHMAPPSRAGVERRIYSHGLKLAAGLCMIMAIVFFVAVQVPPVAGRIPPAIVSHTGIFISILAVDCGLAANRWSRYVAQEHQRGRLLFVIRMTIFSVFCGATVSFGNAANGFGLCAAFALIWLLEASFLAWLMRTGGRVVVPNPALQAE